MQTLLLNENWDIQVDGAGNIATATEAYCTAQTAANAIRLFTNDAYLNKKRGISHCDIELGKDYRISQSVLINRIYKACMAVDGVKDCRVKLNYDKDNRILGGIAYITDNTQTVSIEF